jgi:hypothetical protein
MQYNQTNKIYQRTDRDGLYQRTNRDGLYHRDIGLPVSAKKFQIGEIKLIYSMHARFEAQADRYQLISLPTVLDTNKATLIEVEILGGRLNKLVWRANYSEVFDLIIVLGASGTVKTVWLNLKSDTHKTLDRSKYRKVS